MAEITPPPQRGSVLELDGYTGAWVQQPQRGSVLELDGYTGAWVQQPQRGSVLELDGYRFPSLTRGFRNWVTGAVAFTENAK